MAVGTPVKMKRNVDQVHDYKQDLGLRKIEAREAFFLDSNLEIICVHNQSHEAIKTAVFTKGTCIFVSQHRAEQGREADEGELKMI